MRLLFFILLSFQLIAQDIAWVNNIETIRSYSSPRTTDLNNDNIKDVVIGGGVDGLPSAHGVNAIDGLNGNLIWTTSTSNEMFTSPQFFDVNGDNIDDILIGGRDAELRLINGSNGEVIWEFWTSESNPNDDGWYNFYTSQIIDDLNGDGIHEILAANGGDHSLDDSEINRPPGHIMIINGSNGSVFKTAVVPDSNETYLSPVICDLNNDGNQSIIFGTGGETIQGNLWIADLNELIDEDLSNATPLISNSQLGYLAPPSIGDLNSDGVKDIVTQGFDGKLTAISGIDLSILWQYEIAYTNTESQASPILGKFSNNNYGLDVFATLFSGASSQYSDYYQVLIDGETGNQLWIDSIGDINFSTPIAFDSNLDGKDEVLISIINHNGSYFESELILIDFVNDSQTSLTGPISGGNVACTPQISDVDNDGFLDIIFSVRADSTNPFGDGISYPNGINTMRILTEYTLSENNISWGSYMGTNFDGIYNNGCEWGDLGLFAFPSAACPGENNAMLNLYPSAGTPPYTYLWSNGETTEDLENIGPGLYSVSVTDANGICDTISREVNEYEIISFYQAPSCPDGNDGLVYFNSTGCDCNSSFCQWIWELNGDTIAQGDGSTAEETYKYLFNIEAGTYTATIIHPDGCEIQQEINVPDGTMIDDIDIQNECESNNNGWIDLIVNPADSIIQNYLWSNGETTQDIFNLSAGSYSVIVSDTVCIDTLYFDIENTDFEELLIISDDDIIGPTFTPAPETYSVEMETLNSSCMGILELWIATNSSELWWDAIPNDVGDYESGLCSDGDWCVNIIDSSEFPGWSQITLIFHAEGVYEFLAYANSSCPAYSGYEDSIEITVTDSCSFINIEENLAPNIYTDLNNNLIINLFDQNEKIQVQIFDLNGKKILDSEINTTNIISLDNYPIGIYSLRLLSPDFVYTNKIIVH